MNDLKVIPVENKYIEDACEIAIKAWEYVRKSQKELMGEDIYNLVFDNWQEIKKATVRQFLEKKMGFIALCDNKVAGFACYDIDYKLSLGELHENAVSYDMRGLGIAGKMHHAILDLFKEKKLKYAKVTTGLDDGHAPARRAYEKLGFKLNLPKVLYYQKLEDRYENESYDDLQITPYDKKYLDDILKIALNSWTDIHNAYASLITNDIHDALFSDWKDQLKVTIEKHLTENNGYVALTDGKVAGFSTFRYEFDGKLGVFGHNSVSEDFRGKRIASRMYNFIKYKMAENGTKYAKVTTGLDDGHAPARRAYEKTGFNRMVPTVTYYMEL